MDAWGLLNIAETSVLRCATTVFPLDIKAPLGENINILFVSIEQNIN